MNEKILSAAFPFWSKLVEEEKQKILDSCIQADYQKGVTIHRSDMDCKGVIFVLSGTLRVYILSDEGREVTLFRIHQGENCVLSAACLLDSILFDILIEATEQTQAVIIPTNVLRPMMESNPYVGMYLYKEATERFSAVMWTMQQILFMGVDKRVAIFLWDEMVHQKGTVLKITHEELAHNIGSAREVVTKVLNYFSEEGVVSLRRGKVEIIDKEKLQSWL